MEKVTMIRRTTILASIVLWGVCAAQSQQPTVTLELIPNGVLDHRQAQLYITIESPQELNNAVLDVHASTDFKISPSTITLPSVSRSVIENVSVTLINPDLLAGDQALTVTLSQPSDPATRKILVSKLIKFSYTPEISLWIFFFFAAVGVVIGYWVRLVVKVLGSIEPPSAAPVPPGPQPGPITAFVKAHYYLVDFLVTLIIAFIVLATFIQGGRPPQSGATWYGALASGVGIGLFTNSELLTRLKK
jgi:hypothetical protein